MIWHSNNNFTIASRAASPCLGDVYDPNMDNNVNSESDSDRTDINSDRFSDVLEENSSDISETDSSHEDTDPDSDEGAESIVVDMDLGDHETRSSSPGPSASLSTPALNHLKTKLLGDYKCSAQAPAGRLVVSTLTSIERLSLLHYIAWQTSGGTVKAYNLHAMVLEEATGLTILSLFRVQKLAMHLTRLTPRKVDMCLNS